MPIPALSTPLPALNPSFHDSPALSLRAAPECNYNVRNTAIKLIGTATTTLGPSIFITITTATSNFLNHYISSFGGEDALIQHGRFVYTEPGSNAVISLQNANNHQLTWKVVKAAVEALMWVPELERQYGTEFKIFDGANQVGEGSLWKMGV